MCFWRTSTFGLQKISDRNQVNSGSAGIIAGRTGGAGDGASTEGSTVSSNTANSAINQNQQSTQLHNHVLQGMSKY